MTQTVDAVLAVDDHGAALAAQLRVALQLPGNPPEAVATLTDKLRFRRQLQTIDCLALPLSRSATMTWVPRLRWVFRWW